MGKSLGSRPWVSATAIAVSLSIVAVAERDIHLRPASQISGSKLMWRLVSLNAVGAVAYFIWGRQPPSAAA